MPHARNEPSFSSAAMCPAPTPTSFAPAMPLTCNGSRLRPPGSSGDGLRTPLPICAELPLPHTQSVPSERTAADTPYVFWPLPAAMATTFARPVTSAVVQPVTRVPTPSSPVLLLPQENTLPSRVSARLWVGPAAICVTPVSPRTATGAVALTTRREPAGFASPSPIAPSSRTPHAQTVPSLRNAIACFRPALMAMMSARSVTLTGFTDGLGYVPSGLLLPLGPFPS